MVWYKKYFKKKSHVCIIRLDGVIGGHSRLSNHAINDVNLAENLEKAFKKFKPKAIALAINSPGGTPTQASLIAARIERLAQETNIPVFAFCEDVAASGGYWLACAADEIYVDVNSIIGSIGVISASFGFQDFLEKHGIERRIHTAGDHKSLGDPFVAQKINDIQRLKALQKIIHATFIERVKSRRGNKLSDKDLFNGDVWVGQTAVDLGLVDGIGHLVPVMQAKFGAKVKFNLIGQKKSLLQKIRLTSGHDIVNAAISTAYEKSLWARFGL